MERETGGEDPEGETIRGVEEENIILWTEGQMDVLKSLCCGHV